MHYALTHGQPVNSLLHGCLPIHAASSGGSVGVVRMLLDRGADVNAPRLPRRYSGDTKRSGAPAVGTAGEHPISHTHSSITFTDHSLGSTPLHFAAANGHAQVVQILLASGAVADKQDKNGLTPEDLAEMSGYNEVVHTIRVWYQINGYNRPSTSAPTANVRSRANSFASNQSEVTDASASGSSARKGKERASSMVSAASEKGLRLLRGSFDGKFQRNGSSTNDVSGALRSDGSDSGSVATPYMEPINTSDLPSPVGGDLSSPGGDEDTEETITPDTHQPPTPTSPVDTVSPNFSKEKTSRRPSLPSILEKAAHPGVAFRNRMRKAEGGPATGAIAEHGEDVPESSQNDDQTPGIRGRLRPAEIKAKMDKAKVDKQAILKMFKRDYSPPSRSPSPPPRRAEPAPHPAQVEHDIARLRRASMDPDLVQMAMDAQTLGERLEMSAVTTSAPAAKTRFFESVPPSPSMTSYSDRPSAMANGTDRPSWDRRLSRHSTISPSPLANEWGPGDSSEGSGARKATVRRTMTEVRKPSGEHKGPRRMPSAPSMPSMTSQSIAAFKERQSLSHTPSMTARNGESLTAAASRDGIDSSVIVPKLEALAKSRSRETTADEASPHEGSSTSTVLPPPSTSSTVVDTPSTEAGTDLTPTAQSGLKAPPEVAVSEYLEPPQPENEAVETATASDQTGRYRGESIGSNQTDSTGGVLTTPPSSRVLTPPGSRHPSVGDELDVRCMGMVPTESNALHGVPRTSESSLSAIAAKFPPVPENGVARNMPTTAPPRPPVRTISSHAEARTAMEQAERDVLELAQVPDTASANRDLASQLAAYGETHAIAQEFERAERRTSRTSRSSSDRTSQMSSHYSMSDRERQRVSSHPPPRSTHSRSGSAPSPAFESGWMPMPVNHIYDRREQAYRERLTALTSAAAATTAHHRLPTKSQRYGHISDMWAAGQSSSSLQRRITSPSHRMNGAPPTKNGTPGSGTYPSSLSVTPSLNNSLSNSMASGGKPIMRSSSLTRPTKPGGLRNDARYQGLAAARSYAATSPHAASVRPRHKSDGHDDRQSSEAERDSPVVPNGFVLPDYPQRKVSRKQKFKTALGNLTRR